MERLEILLFYKDKNGNNIPLRFTFTHGYDVFLNSRKNFEEIQKDHPEVKNNLFAFINGQVFKIPFV
ncbi:hypothetical protein QQG09_08870 [Melissococcus plutonius]|uniref:hypothetical protein n=1 Tax=Melissococcus plutonius TaxID=33970 RepID=UPI0021E5BFFE|nr:hypothetical protein [Melissococcus plutonius]MCV2505867.1 hypothetical protein [Melissococcus plutonius]MCV2520633.1 hypothetical protein [Melissococcus plutonius]